MAEKGFGVKEINLIGPSGTPTITSPNNLNLNANNVAISTNVSIGGTLSVTGNVSVGGTLTYEDVTSIDSVGIITARSVIHAGAGLTVVGVSTFNDDVDFGLYGNGAPKITFDDSSDLLWFKKETAGGSTSKIWLGGGTSYDNLQLQQTYTSGGQSEITTTHSHLFLATNTAGKNITLQSSNDIFLTNSGYPGIKVLENGVTNGAALSVELYWGSSNTAGSKGGKKLETSNAGVVITGICTATTFSGSGASLTSLPAGNLTGTVADARISTLTASKLSGALPAISGASLTNIPEPDEAPVVDFSVTANGSSAYRFSGGGVDTSEDDPDLYLIRGQKYRFNNTTGSAHPFQFRATPGGSAYTAGVSGDQNGVQFFTPELDAPGQLYYICTLHSNMVGNIYISGGKYDTTPTQFHIEVRRSGNQTGYDARSSAGGTPVVFNDVVRTRGTSNSALNTSTGKITVPVDGVYFLEASVYTTAGNVLSQGWFTEGSSRMQYSDITEDENTDQVQASGMHYLSANTEVGFHPYGATASSITIEANVYHTWFRVTLIG